MLSFPSGSDQQQQTQFKNSDWHEERLHQDVDSTADQQQQQNDQARLASKLSLSDLMDSFEFKNGNQRSSRHVLGSIHKSGCKDHQRLNRFSKSLNDLHPSKASLEEISDSDLHRSWYHFLSDTLLSESKSFKDLHRSNRQASEASLEEVGKDFHRLIAKDRHRSRRQVSYGGNPAYGTLESIPLESLNKLREGYKDSLKEIVLKPDEDPTAALMRYSTDSIREALYRAGAEPVEVDASPTDVINQSLMPTNQNSQPYANQFPLPTNQNPQPYPNQFPQSTDQNQQAYANQNRYLASQSPYNMVEHIGTPMVYKDGHFYAEESVKSPGCANVRNSTMQSPMGYQAQPFSGQIPATVPGRAVSDLYTPQQFSSPVSQGYMSSVPLSQSGGSPYTYETQQFKAPEQLQSGGSPYTYGAQQFNAPEQIQSSGSPYTYGAQQFNAPEQLRQDDPRYSVQQSPTVTAYQQSNREGGHNQYNQYQQPYTARNDIQDSPNPSRDYNPPSEQYNQYHQSYTVQNDVKGSPIPSRDYNLPSEQQNQAHPKPARIQQENREFENIDPQNPSSTTSELTLKDYLGDDLLHPTLNTFNELMEAIKARLTSCCNKCKKRILESINSNVACGTENDDDDPEDCLSCKTTTKIYSDLQNLSQQLNENVTMTPQTPISSSNTGGQDMPQNQNSVQNDRQPNSIDRQIATQQNIRDMNPNPESIKPRPEEDQSYDEDDYDDEQENIDFNRNENRPSFRSQDARNPKATGYGQPRRSGINQPRQQDQLAQSGNSYRSKRPQSMQESPRSPASGYEYKVKPPQTSNSEQFYAGGYDRGTNRGQGSDKACGGEERRLRPRSGPKENKESGYDYNKQIKLKENIPKSSGYDYNTVAKIRKQKPVKHIEQDHDSELPRKQIQKQLKKLEDGAEKVVSEAMKVDEEPDKKAKLVELLYFLYELSKVSAGENSQTTTETIEVTMKPSVVKEPTEATRRRVKIPKRKGVKTVDHTSIRQAESKHGDSGGSSSLGGSSSVKRSVDHY